jgi:hypothetical protein
LAALVATVGLLVAVAPPPVSAALTQANAGAKELPRSYRLGENECLRWMPVAFRPERAGWLRAAYPNVRAEDSLFIWWNGTPLADGMGYSPGGPPTLGSVCRFILDLYPQEIDTEPALSWGDGGGIP